MRLLPPLLALFFFLLLFLLLFLLFLLLLLPLLFLFLPLSLPLFLIVYGSLPWTRADYYVHSGAFFNLRSLYGILLANHTYGYHIVRSLVLTPELEAYCGEIGLRRRRPIEVGHLHKVRPLLLRVRLGFVPTRSRRIQAFEETQSKGEGAEQHEGEEERNQGIA